MSNAATGAIQVVPFHQTSKRQLAKGVLGDTARPTSGAEIPRQKYYKALQFAQFKRNVLSLLLRSAMQADNGYLHLSFDKPFNLILSSAIRQK